jgi:hypothetical protein
MRGIAGSTHSNIPGPAFRAGIESPLCNGLHPHTTSNNEYGCPAAAAWRLQEVCQPCFCPPQLNAPRGRAGAMFRPD